VQHLIAYWLKRRVPHQTLIDLSSCPPETDLMPVVVLFIYVAERRHSIL
jgi:hypothetical protein